MKLTPEEEADKAAKAKFDRMVEAEIAKITPKEKAKWKRRVDAEVAKMDLSNINIEPELLDALAHFVAADVLWLLDTMKGPGIAHQTLKPKN